MMSEFMRRILESQRRGNPPASRFAIDNLEGSTNLSCQTCTICQVFTPRNEVMIRDCNRSRRMTSAKDVRQYICLANTLSIVNV
jgi:hypothetical protein